MPRSDVDRFLRRLKEGKPVPAVLLLGRESYLRDLCRANIIEAVVEPAAREWGVVRYSARDTRLVGILRQAETRPMLCPCQVVVVSDLEAVEELADKLRQEAVEQLDAYLRDPAPFTVLVLEAASLDQRMTLFKTVAERALVVTASLGESPEERIPVVAGMAVAMARERGLDISEEDARELADILDGDLSRVRIEMDKLAAYAGPSGKVTREDMAAVVVGEKNYSVWQLAEMLAGGDQQRALVFLDGVLRNGGEPVAIVGALAWMVRTLIEAQELPGTAEVWQAVRQLRLREATARLALSAARRISRERLLAALRQLHDADNRLKLGTAPPRTVLEFLVARLTAA